MPRYQADLGALEHLTRDDSPLKVHVRPTGLAVTSFQFWDASRVGLGQSLWFMGSDKVDVFYGLWDEDAAGRRQTGGSSATKCWE